MSESFGHHAFLYLHTAHFLEIKLYFQVMQDTRYSSGVLQYIPFFYVIWSDDLLSASEIAVVTKAISEDITLEKTDRKTLLSWLDGKHGPKNHELKQWQQLLSNSGVKLVESETYPLATFSQKVVCEYKELCPFNEQLKQIEINLGIQPNHYNHLFDVEVVHEKTSTYYEAAKIDEIFKGRYSSVVDDFRKLLTAGIFSWEVQKDKTLFREKVLKQLQRLATRGIWCPCLPQSLWRYWRHKCLCIHI